MKKINRLLKNEDFKNVIDQKHKLFNNSFSIYYSFNNLGKLRAGISVSKKLGIAVIRNKIKRQIRMIVQDVVPIDINLDLVVIASHNFSNLDYIENKTNFVNLFNKIKAKEKI